MTISPKLFRQLILWLAISLAAYGIVVAAMEDVMLDDLEPASMDLPPLAPAGANDEDHGADDEAEAEEEVG